MSPPVVVLGDLHLTPDSPPAVVDDLARLLERHAGARVVCAGDLFDLSADGGRRPHGETVRATFGRHPRARAALGGHVDRGGDLWLVAGNHDAEVGGGPLAADLLTALGVAPEARPRVRMTPWFFRHGALHVEHGHLFDPDNAPAHPLVVGERSLGVQLMEEFVAPAGAHRYLNNNDGTPLTLFLAAFTWYGPRAPYVVYRYFHAALGALARSGPLYRGGGEADAGARRVAAFAEEAGVDPDEVARLVGLGAAPTMQSLAGTFTRLYLDRVLCTLAIAGGVGATLAGRRLVGAALGSLGALAMGTSWALGHDRYGGTLPERLAAGAASIAATTGAKLVVFGHTHREAMSDGYANTGSFAFPGDAPGRPYLVVDGPPERPSVARHHLIA